MSFILQYPPVVEGSMRQLATEIRKDLQGGGQVSDDSRLSLRQIEVLIRRVYDEVVTALDRRDFKEGKQPDPRRITKLGCYPLVDATSFSCGCTQFSWSAKEITLPRLYAWRGVPYISYLGFADMITPFVRVDSVGLLNSHASLSAKPAFTIVSDKAYMVIPDRYALICDVVLFGIPEDPTKTESNLCFDVWAQDWAVSPAIKEQIRNIIIERWGKLVIETQGLQDVRNNGSDGNYRSSILKD